MNITYNRAGFTSGFCVHCGDHINYTSRVDWTNFNRFSGTITLSSDVIVWASWELYSALGEVFFYHKHAVPAIGSWWGNKTPSEQETVYIRLVTRSLHTKHKNTVLINANCGQNGILAYFAAYFLVSLY